MQCAPSNNAPRAITTAPLSDIGPHLSLLAKTIYLLIELILDLGLLHQCIAVFSKEKSLQGLQKACIKIVALAIYTCLIFFLINKISSFTRK